MGGKAVKGGRHQNYSGEREARDIFLIPLPKAGVRGFLPRKFFEIADARTCVLIHFKAPKLLPNCLTFLEKNIFFVSLGKKLRPYEQFHSRACFKILV